VKSAGDKGYEECKWAKVLDYWSNVLKDVPFYKLPLFLIKDILKIARLQQAATPQHAYELLRRLGSSILDELSDEETLRGLKEKFSLHQSDDTSHQRNDQDYADKMDKSEIEKQIKAMRGKDGPVASTEEEEKLGFVVLHVRSDRYYPIEIGAIIRYLVSVMQGTDSCNETPRGKGALAQLVTRWKQLSKDLQALDENGEKGEQKKQEAQRFISTCYDAYHRAQIAFDKEEKRCWQLGVILQHGESRLDAWYERYRQDHLTEVSIEQHFEIIREEKGCWKKRVVEVKRRLNDRGIDIPSKEHDMFKYASTSIKSLADLAFLGNTHSIADMQQQMAAYAKKKKHLAGFAEKVEIRECVKEVMNSFKPDSGQEQNLADDRSGKGKLVAVFGHAPPDALGEEAVIVRNVPLPSNLNAQSELGDETISIIEIGLRLEGSYLEYKPQKDDSDSMVASSASIKVKEEDMIFFKYIRPEHHVPHSKTIAELFHTTASEPAFTDVLILIPEPEPDGQTGQEPRNNAYSEVSDAGGRFMIDLKNPGTVRTDGANYYPIPVKPGPSTVTEDKGTAGLIPFQRLAVMLPPSISPQYIHLHQKLPRSSIKGGFSESAEIIAQVLALAHGAKHGINRPGSSTGQEQLKGFLKGSPLLLYYTTIELLNYFSAGDPSNNFAETVATFWADKLKTSDSRSFFSREERESRLLVLTLITSGTTYVGNAQSVSRIALASEAHLKYLPRIIREETKFNQQSVYVEETNFESTLLRLRTISTASITFIFIYITGRMSAYQVEELVRAAANPIKLIFRHSHSLLSLLELTDVRDLIERPESLKSGTKAERPCVVYLQDSPVGALVQYTTEEISKKPTALSEGQYWDRDVPEKRIDCWMQWKDSVVQWLEMEPTDEDKFSSFVRILVTAEPDVTCASLKEQHESRFNAEVVKAGKDMDFHRLKAFLDNEHLPLQSQPALKGPTGGLPRFDAEPDLPKSNVLVLSEAHLLPHSRLEVLVSRCCVQRSKLLLLVNKASSLMSRFRVFEDIGAPPTYTHVPAIFQRLETQTNHSLCFRGLQLIFSHEVLTSDPKHVELINKATGVKDDVNIEHLSFLDRKDTLQYRVYLKDLLDGLKREERLVLQDKGTKEKGTTLAVLLAAHVRQYLLCPLEEEPERRRHVSFKDFCSQPQVRLLGQIHRIEAYICFLFSKTKESQRYSSDETQSPTVPLGTPLTQNFVVLDNTHVGYSPGKLLAAEFDPASAATMASVRSPAYVDPGNGDAMLDMQEITEHKAISCEELHWNALVSRWKNGHDLQQHQMEHILNYSPSRISVLLSLSVHQIERIPELSRSAYEAVKCDFLDSKTLLRMPSTDHFRELRTRVASICWLIVKTGTTLRDSDSKIDDLSTEFFLEDYSIMIEDGFKLNLEICPENLKLLSAFARAIIGLDRFDALTEQQTVASFIFSDAYMEEIEKVLDFERIGAAFVWACVAHERVKAIIEGKGGKAIFQRFGALLQWVRDPSDANAAEMGQSLSATLEGSTSPLSQRFSALAISAILQSVRTNQFSKVMQTACTHLLSVCIQDRAPKADPKAFLSDVLQPFCKNKSLRGHAVALVHAVSTAKLETNDDEQEASEQWRFELPSSLYSDEPWESMCRAFRDKSHAEDFFRRASEQNFALPFNSSEHLCDMYVSYVSMRPITEGSVREVAAEIKLHKGLIPDEVSKRAIFNHMVRRSREEDPSNAELVLFWFTWWFDLASVLPNSMSPTRATWALFQEVLRELRAEVASSLSRIMLEESGLSTWARFMLAPYTLPVSIFNVLTLKVTEDESLLIRSQAFLLAQDKSNLYPAYAFRTHVRPLPPECIQALVQRVSKDREVPVDPCKMTMKDKFPQTNLGVSPTTVAHNFTILLNLDQLYSKCHGRTKEQIFITLRVWFQAAGFQMKDLLEMCRESTEKTQLSEGDKVCIKVCGQAEFVEALVNEPLPVYGDVRLVSGRVVLFDTRAESRATTKQWISMLLTQYDVHDGTLPERFERYAIARSGNQPFSRSEPNDIVRDLFYQVGDALTKRHKDFTLSAPGSESALVDSLLPLGEFFSQLLISMDPERYDMLAAVAFKGLTLGLKSKKNDDLHVCIADGLFALLGITPLNGGMEIAHMLKAWKEQDLACAASVLEEVEWMRKNVYTKNDSKIAARLSEVSKPTTKPYTRPSANEALIKRLDDPAANRATYEATYDFFGDVAKSLQREHVASLLPPKHSDAKPGPSNDPPSLQEVHVPSFDHVPHASPALAGQINAVSSVTLFRRNKESAAVGQQRRMHGVVGTKAVELNKSPQTISARGLVHLQSRSRFGVLKIQPGLHPILRSAGDERNTPVLRWREEQKKKDKIDARSSFDSGDADACTKIEHIFSHNGDTWDHLNRLPPDSTIVGRGFYLRKTERSDQGWMLLLGASDRKAVEKPPFWLWTLMDTMHLGSLDFDKDVVQILKSMVVIGFKVQKPDPEQLRDERFGDVLDEIRRSSLDDEDQTAYAAYLKREEKVCQHFKKVLLKLQKCQTSKPLLEMLDLVDLEASLGSKGNFVNDQISQTLSRLLCIICEKRDTVPRSQLIFCLDLALSNHWARSDGVSEQGRPGPSQDDTGASEGEHAAPEISLQKQKSDFYDISCDSQKIMNKQLAAHEHITKRNFREQSVQYIENLEKENQEDWRIVWTEDFYDSEDENDVLTSRTFAGNVHAGDSTDSNDRHLDSAVTHTDLKERRVQTRKYDDDDYDTPSTAESKRQNALLPTRWGYGVATSSTVRVLSLLSENVPLYFLQVDCRQLKIKYSDAEGLPIAMVFHKILLHRVLKQFAASLGSEASSTDAQQGKRGKMLHFRQKMLSWLVDLVRSPLPLAAVYWFMDKVEHGATTLPVPFMGGDAQRESEDINLKAIAHCVANAIPKSMVGREVLMGFDLEPQLVPFCTRKNDMYGIHIVQGGTLARLEEAKVNVEVCELGYDALTQAKDNASMYLSIISRFSKYTWIVYVTGLDSIDDALLKWLAEYTKLHPWRFVYLENTQTSWNFSENRDRCCYLVAPPTIESKIETVEDLLSEDVRVLRPHHRQPYDRLKVAIEDSGVSLRDARDAPTWDSLSSFCSTFFAKSEPGKTAALDWKSLKPESMKKGEEELSVSVGTIFTSAPETPCVVLLCSPPGTGKSYFSEQLARSVKSQHATIDGSDDRLVDMALREILEIELPDASKRLFLIVDEFHMLRENHKVDLFSWLKERARNLQVLLIANRKDARDEELLETFKKESGVPPERVQSITTRLSLTNLNTVMDDEGVQHKDAIRRWVHCARCLFGGEAVSLRNLKDLDAAIDDPRSASHALERLLLDKRPIISKATAHDFVACFMESRESRSASHTRVVEAVANICKGAVSLMFQAALCTEKEDRVGMDYPDFVAFGLPFPYDAPPSLRIAAWCCHMREAANATQSKQLVQQMDGPESIFGPMLVDQCGFPLQLLDQHTGPIWVGLAFSWSGDYSQLREITNAVKRGHSVDWNGVRRRCWERDDVQDSSGFVELLSVCTSPGKVLEALNKTNLCDLLRKSSPSDSLRIARSVLENQTHREDRCDHPNPYRTAIWMIILYDKKIKAAEDLLAKMSSTSEDRASEEELVNVMKWASVQMRDMIDCDQDDDPENKTALLVDMLIHLSDRSIAAGNPHKVHDLWFGIFAPLLQACLPAAGSKGRPTIVVTVAIHAVDQNEKWPGPVRALWSIAHGQGTADHVSNLWGDLDLRRLLYAGPGAREHADEEQKPPVQRDLAGGILAVAGVIPPSLQEALLVRGGDANLDSFADDMDRAMTSIIDTIEKIATDKDRHFTLAKDTEFERLVIRTARRFGDREDDEDDHDGQDDEDGGEVDVVARKRMQLGKLG